MGKCADGHIPTCMLHKKQISLYSTWKCSAIKMLEDTSESFADVDELYFVGTAGTWEVCP